MTFFGAVKNAESAVIFIFPLTEMQFTPLLFFFKWAWLGQKQNRFQRLNSIFFSNNLYSWHWQTRWERLEAFLLQTNSFFLRKKDSKFLPYLVGGKFSHTSIWSWSWCRKEFEYWRRPHWQNCSKLAILLRPLENLAKRKILKSTDLKLRIQVSLTNYCKRRLF